MSIFDNANQLELILVRAGSTDLDNQGRITGALDVPLSELGKTEAKETANELASRVVDAIYCAKCQAAQQTAAELSKMAGVKIRIEDSWTNLDHGLWHGKCWEELKENQPKLYKQWHENPGSVYPPGGETFDEVRQRVASSVKRIRKKHRSGVVAIVAPEPLYTVVREEFEASIKDDTGSSRQSSLRWESIELAIATA